MRNMTPADGCVWITGASSGIGRALALRMSQEGWTVVATARSRQGLNKLACELENTKGKLILYPGDISDRHGIQELVNKIEVQEGPVALAVLNAGVYLPVDTTNLTAGLDDFKASFDINVLGTAHCIAALVEHMKHRGAGHIAVVSSVTGYGGLPTSGAYGATKAALINLTECMAIELPPLGIQTTLINPGFVDTPAQDDLSFAKPFMISADAAADRIVRGLRSKKFEITFPRRFTWALKVLNNLLPKDLYIRLVRYQTRPR